MATIPHTCVHKPGVSIIAELEALRDAHRLGIHIWEEQYGAYYPFKTADLLARRDMDTCREKPTFSLSVLPAAQDGFTMAPYQCDWGTVGKTGYLIDLRENQPNPPHIIATCPDSITSGTDYFNKKYSDAHTHRTIDAMMERMALNHRRRKAVYPQDWFEHAEFNEVLAQMGPQHVKAIVAPMFDSRFAHYREVIELQAALAGLDHAGYGQAIPPVVLYHVTGTEKGQFTYLGQSRQELLAVVDRCVESIGANETSMDWLRQNATIGSLWDSLSHNAGLDMDEDTLRATPARSATTGVHSHL